MTGNFMERFHLLFGSDGILRQYIALSKPKIILLLLLTALGGMFLGQNGFPNILIVIHVLLGGTFASAGANAINQYLDRDIDAQMIRTQKRPIISGRIKPSHAWIFGVFLNLVAFVWLVLGVNILAALLTLSATLFYVFVYTIFLKRSSTQNIVIGGAAGSIPPVVGWVAVTGELTWPALFLFAIVFFWTPPHFWALALLIKDDYEKVNIPMLPVVVGVTKTKRSIFFYTIVMFFLTTAFWILSYLFMPELLGWIYLIGSLGLSGGFIFFAWRLLRKVDIDGAKTLYLYSLLYLALVYVLLMVESIV